MPDESEPTTVDDWSGLIRIAMFLLAIVVMFFSPLQAIVLAILLLCQQIGVIITLLDEVSGE